MRAARERVRQLDALCSAAGAGAEALAPEDAQAPGAAAVLAGAAARLDAVAGVDERLDGLAQRLHTLVIDSQDVGAELRKYALGSEPASMGSASDRADPAHMTLEAIEQRLAEIERVLRKHGGSVEAVEAHADRASARREELAGAEVALAEATARLREARAELEGRVRALRAARR